MTGCTPISEGCEHCYAERFSWRFSGSDGRCHGCPAHDIDEEYTGHHYGEATFREVDICERGVETFEDSRCLKPWFLPAFHPDRLDKPLHWRKPRRVFVCSMSDLFHEAFTDEQVIAAFSVMRRCWNRAYEGREPHTFMLLTKRPERMRDFCLRLRFDGGTSGRGVYLADDADAPGYPLMPHRGSTGLGNVWLGVAAENQQRANERIPILLGTPAAKRFVSIEPMLGPVSLFGHDAYALRHALDWVILGAETGPGARPMQPEWALDVHRQCRAAAVPFFWKRGSKGLVYDAEMTATREVPGE